MTQIICLANSRKHEERCIAGINPQTGRWIRPIYSQYPDDGRVPQEIRFINGEEPKILDLLDIPLENTGNDFGFESENLNISSGKWQRLNSIPASDLIQYCSDTPYILHNLSKYVNVSYLQQLPFQKRCTLQLVYALRVILKKEIRSTGIKWKGSLITKRGQQLTEAAITDPEFAKKLDNGYLPINPCLVTVSVSMPHRPSNWEGDDPCWKLIAGVIELSDTDLILVEMNRISWTIEQGRNHLKQNYNKQSRQQLNSQEIQEFLNFLKSHSPMNN
ncbi:dual OB domain-containing protein [Crocosphaera sp. XPORK-15E]|uniref:dual OB domain-containing protein n=1 Tax=Crocosphaera sp. XPORK-15E TaxID=3110247 RepID=UPI002B2098A3|nr:hypothetical protein [Crocosphaera sp. XPORK-15E]MEA5536330.1 hypothetical protein [Crocosphaera sp. XPORK-15E]